jgi:hypothetical protein
VSCEGGARMLDGVEDAPVAEVIVLERIEGDAGADFD